MSRYTYRKDKMKNKLIEILEDISKLSEDIIPMMTTYPNPVVGSVELKGDKDQKEKNEVKKEHEKELS
jgi:hypothetical protein